MPVDGKWVSFNDLNNKRLVTDSICLKWPGLFNLPPRNGKLKSSSIEKFDYEFFSIPDNTVQHIDPQERLMLELVAETIIDAG